MKISTNQTYIIMLTYLFGILVAWSLIAAGLDITKGKFYFLYGVAAALILIVAFFMLNNFAYPIDDHLRTKLLIQKNKISLKKIFIKGFKYGLISSTAFLMLCFQLWHTFEIKGWWLEIYSIFCLLVICGPPIFGYYRLVAM